MAQPAYMTLPEAAAYLRVPTEQIRAARPSAHSRHDRSSGDPKYWEKYLTRCRGAGIVHTWTAQTPPPDTRGSG